SGASAFPRGGDRRSRFEHRRPPDGRARRFAPMLFVIIGHDAPDASERRPAVRPAHLAHLDPVAKAGRIRLAGPLLDRSGSPTVPEGAPRAEGWALDARDSHSTRT